jgi:hypothetical protein
VVVGGGGRFLVLHLPREHKLAVFDVSEGKVVRYLPTAADDVLVAAGMTKLVVVRPGQPAVVERWSLTTFKRETEAPVAMTGSPVAAAMGSASDGPLVITTVTLPELGETVFFDVPRMKRVAQAKGPHDIFRTGPDVWLRAAADGYHFACQQDRKPSFQRGEWFGPSFLTYGDGTGDAPVPGPNGQRVFTTNGVLGNPTGGEWLGLLQPLPRTEGRCLPAAHGDFWMGLSSDGKAGARGRLSFHLGDDDRAFATLDDVEGLPHDAPAARGKLAADKRVHFIPDAKLLVTIPEGGNKLVLRHFDAEAALAKSGLDYLLVTSRPPGVAISGREYSYQLAVRCRDGKVRYELKNGFEGMRIDATGKLTWAVPADLGWATGNVIILVRSDKGPALFYVFRVLAGQFEL